MSRKNKLILTASMLMVVIPLSLFAAGWNSLSLQERRMFKAAGLDPDRWMSQYLGLQGMYDYSGNNPTITIDPQGGVLFYPNDDITGVTNAFGIASDIGSSGVVANGLAVANTAGGRATQALGLFYYTGAATAPSLGVVQIYNDNSNGTGTPAGLAVRNAGSGNVVNGVASFRQENASESAPAVEIWQDGTGPAVHLRVQASAPSFALAPEGGFGYEYGGHRLYYSDNLEVQRVANIEDGPRILGTATSVDLAAVALVDVYTVPSGKNAVITGMLVEVSEVSGFSAPGTATVRAEGTSISASTTLAGLDNSGEVWTFYISGLNKKLSAGQNAELNITGAAVATSLLATVRTVGWEYTP